MLKTETKYETNFFEHISQNKVNENAVSCYKIRFKFCLNFFTTTDKLLLVLPINKIKTVFTIGALTGG